MEEFGDVFRKWWIGGLYFEEEVIIVVMNLNKNTIMIVIFKCSKSILFKYIVMFFKYRFFIFKVIFIIL